MLFPGDSVFIPDKEEKSVSGPTGKMPDQSADSQRREEGLLVFDDLLVPFTLSTPTKIGHLDPVVEVSGQKARLNNLAYARNHETNNVL